MTMKDLKQFLQEHGTKYYEKIKEEIVECNECGGGGFSGYGTGYDAVCDQCGGQGKLPKSYIK